MTSTILNFVFKDKLNERNEVTTSSKLWLNRIQENTKAREEHLQGFMIPHVYTLRKFDADHVPEHVHCQDSIRIKLTGVGSLIQIYELRSLESRCV
eukprot:CAMPEP_0114279748 /NCGR_PEP_ID=MMETSP0059-20121206/2061_1 /TAXON_ID=36894 /ORGANISM="Pyramimonas parkeae, Strain CCMP726" /LENGTH=95 /DNA_ID=CAMNT_0001400085 /DNA_START=1068 /DNA_END=1352 /DNA_ORIENTATION=+